MKARSNKAAATTSTIGNVEASTLTNSKCNGKAIGAFIHHSAIEVADVSIKAGKISSAFGKGFWAGLTGK